MEKCISIFSLITILLTTIGFGQSFQKEEKSLNIKAAQGTIKIDGSTG